MNTPAAKSKSIESRSSEEETLDRAITSIDPMLRASLQRDQKRRRKKIAIWGIVMATLCIAVLLALAFSGGLPSGAHAAPPTAAEIEINRLEEAADLSAAGWKLWKSQKWTEASTKFEAALKLDPQSENAWNGLGWSLLNSGKREDSIVAFKECLKINPNHPAALNGIGQLALASRDYNEAEKHFLAAKNASAAWYGLVKLYVLQEKYDEAGKWLEKLKATPGFSEKDLKMFAEAIESRSVSDEFRNRFEPPKQDASKIGGSDLSRRGWQLFSQGKFRPAMVAFKQVLDNDPDDLIALNGMGFCLLNSGNPVEAQPMFEKLLKAQPKHGGALNGLGRVLMAQNKEDEAIATWMKCEEAMGDQVTAATHGLALAHFKRKEYSKAIEFLKRIVKDSPDNKAMANMLAKSEKALEE